MTDAGDHFRPTTDGYEPGVYRVVGAEDDIALLRLTDDDGNRVHSGELRHCSRDALDTEWESAGNPDTGFRPALFAENVLSWLYWSVRRFF